MFVCVLLFKILNKKQSSGEEKDDFEQSDFKPANSFSVGFSILHIEEDPFANDFKEDKFIDKNMIFCQLSEYICSKQLPM